MAVRLNRRAYEHAKRLIWAGNLVLDDRDDWSEHQPSARAENEYLERRGFSAYGRWYLGVDSDRPADTKSRYKYPYSDFSALHRCAVLTVESRAAQNRHDDIKAAAAHLHGMLDASVERGRAAR